MKHTLRVSDLIVSQDGSLSLTKLAACTAHLFMACAFFRLQVMDRAAPFNQELWIVYGGYAILHAFADKTVATYKDFKDAKLAQGAEAGSTTTTVTVEKP